MNDVSKMNQIEWIRFLFAVIIVYFHLLHQNIMAYTGKSLEKYETLATQSAFSYAIVECFYILAGYFLYHSYVKRPEETIGAFAYKKFARLWPVLAFSTIIQVLIFDYKWYPQLFNLLFLQCVGVSLEYKGINWYISPYFFVMIFYFAVLKCSKDKKKTTLFIAVLVYFSYVLNINETGGGFGRETVHLFFNLAVFRAVAGIGQGCLLAAGLREVSENRKFNQTLVKTGRILSFLEISLVEAGSLLLLLVNFLWCDYAYNNQFIVVIMFSILLICMKCGKGILSRIFNRKIFGIWGKYSYSIYVMQQISFYILQRTIWKNQDFVENHMYRCLGVSILFSVAVGIGTYYVVEKPAMKILLKLRK